MTRGGTQQPAGRFGIVVFPGSNCDRDCHYVLKEIMKQEVEYLWHDEDHTLARYDALIVPGGFSYGDYLRSGAIAKFSRALSGLGDFIESGKPVLGICNGFQILLECGYLPGAMNRNQGLKFICDWTPLRLENADTPFTCAGREGEIYRLPIAHMDGNYCAPEEVLDELERERRVVLRYSGENPNGSARAIAGIVNRARNVMGLMPHPERASESILGSADGRMIFESLRQNISRRRAAA